MNRNKLILAGLMGILVLGGCAKYKAKPLNRLTTYAPAPDKPSTMSISYRVLNQEDCEIYLDRNVIAQGYQPIQVTIANNSGRTFNFDLKSLSLQTVSALTVAETVHTDTVARAVGYGVAGVFIWPFIIPAIVDGIGSSQANDQLDADFYAKTLQSQIIKPFSVVNGLIFVALKNFDSNFRLTLIDVETGEPVMLCTDKIWVKI